MLAEVSSSHRPTDKAPRAMAIVGDSISTGLFANTLLGERLPSGTALKVLWSLSNYLKNGASMDFEYLDRQHAATHITAFGGTQPYSHAQKIRDLFGLKAEDFPVNNVARASAASVDALPQIEKLRSLYAQRPEQRADYVIFALGNNDLCDSVSLDDFRDNYRRALWDVLWLHPNADVLVFSLVDLPAVIREVTDDRIAFMYDSVLNKNNPISCGQLRNMTKICKKITKDRDGLALFSEYNRVVQDVVAEFRSTFSGRIMLAGESGSPYVITANDVAADCFHPSVNGHRKIAELTWPETWFQKPH